MSRCTDPRGGEPLGGGRGRGPRMTGRRLPFCPGAFGGPQVDEKALGPVAFPLPEGPVARAAAASPRPCQLDTRLFASELARSGLPGVGERPSTTLLAGEGFRPGLGLLKTQFHFITAQGRKS